eukprot:scaffold18149_cov48-Cyclotella_meneghiniana.AAC.5
MDAMDWLEAEQNYHLREHLQKWGPSPNKVTWTELCRTSSLANPQKAKNISPHAPIFMSEQLFQLKQSYRGQITDSSMDEILQALRPEDAIHIPMLRVDDKGQIVDWNRSMCDLTGFSAAQMIGESYTDILDEWMPHLTNEYKKAAFDWLKSKDDVESEFTEEKCRADYLFPLPLPLNYEATFKYTSGRKRHYNEYIELFVARTDRLVEVYPAFDSGESVPQYWITGMNQERDRIDWYFDTAGWVGGLEFTLRRKNFVPSLTKLCRELLPEGGPTFNCDGSVTITNVQFKETSTNQSVYRVICNYTRLCNNTGLKYTREVLNIVYDRVRKMRRETKVFTFTEDWSSNPRTSTINKYILIALGGEQMIEQGVESGKMIWTTGKKEEGGNDTKMEKKIKKQRYERNWLQMRIKWRDFREYIFRVSDRTLLTLKIEGHKRSNGSWGDEEFRASATVQLPASLNFFQLHRVVCQTMNCRAEGTRETHKWFVPNLDSLFDYPLTNEHCETMSIGESYFVERGKRVQYSDDMTMFDRGMAIRQRISRTGTYVDKELPLNPDRNPYSNAAKIQACIHSTCISCVFYQTGTSTILSLGFGNYYTKYKVTCMKMDKYTGPLPANPNINIMTPKCLRGKPEDGNDSENGWSVAKANDQLHKDQGCLRRKLGVVGNLDYLTEMPLCRNCSLPVNQVHEKSIDLPHPLAPPLPSSGEYAKYILSLYGRIDERFLQEKITGEFGEFSVPFRYGGTKATYDSDLEDAYHSDSSSGHKRKTKEERIGKIWEREVDEEMERMGLSQTKKKTSGKKRKASKTN